MMFSNCGTGEDPWRARRSNQSILKEINPEYLLVDWYWSWSFNALATWWEESTHWKRPWWQEKKGVAEDEMVGCHQELNGHECERSLGDSEGQGSLACCSPWDCKESDTTEWLNNCKSVAYIHALTIRKRKHEENSILNPLKKGGDKLHQGSEKTYTLKNQKHWWIKLKIIQRNGKISLALGLEN